MFSSPYARGPLNEPTPHRAEANSAARYRRKRRSGLGVGLRDRVPSPVASVSSLNEGVEPPIDGAGYWRLKCRRFSAETPLLLPMSRNRSRVERDEMAKRVEAPLVRQHDAEMPDVLPAHQVLVCELARRVQKSRNEMNFHGAAGLRAITSSKNSPSACL